MNKLFMLIFVVIFSTGTAHAITLTFQEGDGGMYSDTDATYILSYTPNNNFGENSSLMADDNGVWQTLIKYDNIFGSEAGQVPFGASIASAKITLTVTGKSVDDINVYRISSNWDENTVTYNNFGGYDNSVTLFTFNPADTGVTYDIDITQLTQYWSDQTVLNQGILLFNPGFDSSYYMSDDNTTISGRPMLTVVFNESPIPEPTSIAMLFISTIGLVTSKSRKR